MNQKLILYFRIRFTLFDIFKYLFTKKKGMKKLINVQSKNFLMTLNNFIAEVILFIAQINLHNMHISELFMVTKKFLTLKFFHIDN